MSEGIATQATLVAALARASRAELSAYVLEPGSAVVRALEAAGDRGAHVRVRLEGNPYAGRAASDDLVARNRAVAAGLAAHGVVVRLTTADDLPTHLKAALVDGTAYLDDRNWPSDGLDTIVATSDSDDVAVVAAALDGTPGSDGHLATEKLGALAFEARAIERGSGDRVEVESESFGYSKVSHALFARARRGAHVRLLVSLREYSESGRTELASLRRLANAGVEIRVVANDEKLCLAGDRGWIGSANATFEENPMLDWGMATRDGALLRGARAAFERNWALGRRVAF